MGSLLTAAPDHSLCSMLDLGNCGIGASTGYMESGRGHWQELIGQARSVSDDVIELSALSAAELPDLLSFLADDHSLSFNYVSVHGPAKGWHGNWQELATELDRQLPSYVRSVVMHPDALGDVGAFNVLGSRLILENMDCLKGDARTVEEMAPYFAMLPKAGFCFDIAHAYIIDRSMSLAHDLLDAYGDRLREVHLSSIQEDGTHIPLRAEDVGIFWPVLRRCTHVPWVLEAELPSMA